MNGAASSVLQSVEEIADGLRQRALFDLPGWEQSLAAARERLGYEPAWQPRAAGEPGDPDKHDTWLLEHQEDLIAEAAKAAKALGLTTAAPMLSPGRSDQGHVIAGSFAEYWLACFLSSYTGETLYGIGLSEDIRMVGVVPPRMFAEVQLTSTPGIPHRRLTISIDERFATSTTIDEAAKFAKGLLGLKYRPKKSVSPVVDAGQRAARVLGNYSRPRPRPLTPRQQEMQRKLELAKQLRDDGLHDDVVIAEEAEVSVDIRAPRRRVGPRCRSGSRRDAYHGRQLGSHVNRAAPGADGTRRPPPGRSLRRRRRRPGAHAGRRAATVGSVHARGERGRLTPGAPAWATWWANSSTGSVDARAGGAVHQMHTYKKESP